MTDLGAVGTLFDLGPPPPPAPTAAPGVLSLCVLASGSGGNCSVVRVGGSGTTRTILIDAGIGPRAASRVLAGVGVRLHEVSDLLVTHLDHDHFRDGWMRQRDFRATVHLHRRHWPMAQSLREHRQRVHLFDSAFEAVPGLVVDPLLQHHDEHGVVAFRLLGCSGDLGFATDLGRVTPELLGHFRGVSLLAIESNYCPRMQAESARPEFLKRRIMGGAGHLSNQQCAEVAGAVSPAHAVLLHLSRQCNTPELALAGHAGRGYGVTVSSQSSPTGWIGVGG